MHIALLILQLLTGDISHDIQVAYFKIHQSGEEIAVDFVFEKEDVHLTLGTNDKELTDQSMQAYLEEHFSLIIDDQKQSLVYGAMAIQEKHITLQAKPKAQISQIKTLKIENTCLLDIKKHSNIIQIRLYDQARDFLMNKDRTEIHVQY